jgi:hypothetical protein
VSQRQKLFAKIKNNPRDVRFDDALKAARYLGFVHEGTSGTSHRAMQRSGEEKGLNFQRDKNGKIPAYQAKQLIEMIEKYE